MKILSVLVVLISFATTAFAALNADCGSTSNASRNADTAAPRINVQAPQTQQPAVRSRTGGGTR